jgi:hypothetical protein
MWGAARDTNARHHSLLAGSVVHAQTYKDVWIDVRKPWRSNAEQSPVLAGLVPVEL